MSIYYTISQRARNKMLGSLIICIPSIKLTYLSKDNCKYSMRSAARVIHACGSSRSTNEKSLA